MIHDSYSGRPLPADTPFLTRTGIDFANGLRVEAGQLVINVPEDTAEWMVAGGQLVPLAHDPHDGRLLASYNGVPRIDVSAGPARAASPLASKPAIED